MGNSFNFFKVTIFAFTVVTLAIATQSWAKDANNKNIDYAAMRNDLDHMRKSLTQMQAEIDLAITQAQQLRQTLVKQSKPVSDQDQNPLDQTLQTASISQSENNPTPTKQKSTTSPQEKSSATWATSQTSTTNTPKLTNPFAYKNASPKATPVLTTYATDTPYKITTRPTIDTDVEIDDHLALGPQGSAPTYTVTRRSISPYGYRYNNTRYSSYRSNRYYFYTGYSCGTRVYPYYRHRWPRYRHYHGSGIIIRAGGVRIGIGHLGRGGRR